MDNHHQEEDDMKLGGWRMGVFCLSRSLVLGGYGGVWGAFLFHRGLEIKINKNDLSIKDCNFILHLPSSVFVKKF